MADSHTFGHDGELPGGAGVFVGVRCIPQRRVEPALRHNLRHLVAGHPCPDGVDGHLTVANEIIAGAIGVEDALGRMADAIALHALVPPARKDAAHLVEVVFGAPPALVRHGEYLRECVALMVAQCDCIVISAVIHRDQGAPHVHCLLMPIRAGKWVGSRLLDKRAVMKLRAALFAGPAARYGLRQAPRLTGVRKAEAVRLVLAQMQHSPAIECPSWPAIMASIEANPVPFLGCWGLAAPVAEKPARSFTAIMTSTGRRTCEDAQRRAHGFAD